jgi:serine/threonine protein kinase
MSLQDFTPVELLGKGSSGFVWKIKINSSGNFYATKMYQPELNFIKSHEASMMKQVQGHDGFIQLLEEGNNFIMMELVDCNLYEFLQEIRFEKKDKKKSFLKTITNQLISSISFLHEKGIAHLDLKPENIGIIKNEDGTIATKIMDFGNCQYEKDIDQNWIHQTCNYRSFSDQFEKKIGKKSDIWSLGCILWEINFDEYLFSNVYDCLSLTHNMKKIYQKLYYLFRDIFVSKDYMINEDEYIYSENFRKDELPFVNLLKKMVCVEKDRMSSQELKISEELKMFLG